MLANAYQITSNSNILIPNPLNTGFKTMLDAFIQPLIHSANNTSNDPAHINIRNPILFWMETIYGNNFRSAHPNSIWIRAVTSNCASCPAQLINKTSQSIQRVELNNIQNHAKASNLAGPLAQALAVCLELTFALNLPAQQISSAIACNWASHPCLSVKVNLIYTLLFMHSLIFQMQPLLNIIIHSSLQL